MSRCSRCWHSCWPRAVARRRQGRHEQQLVRLSAVPAAAARSWSAPSRSRTAPTGSPAGRRPSWGLYTMQVAHDAPRVRLREEGRRLDRGPEHRCSTGEPDGHDGRRQADRDLQDQPERGVVRRRADHLDRLQVHAGSRSSTATTSTTRPATRRSRASTTPTRRPPSSRSSRPSPAGSELFGAVLRRHAVAHPRGQGPQRGDGGRLRLVRWSVDRQVGQGRAGHPDAEPELVRRQAEARQGHLQVPGRHRSRVQGVQDRRDARRSTRSRSSTRSSRSQAGIPGTNSFFTADTGNVEALWINNDKAPFTSKAVRQAFAYAIDRDAIVKRLFGGARRRQGASTRSTRRSFQRTRTRSVGRYKQDLDKVDQPDGGRRLGQEGGRHLGQGRREGRRSRSRRTTGNKRRELTEQILQEQLKAAGFEMTIENQSADDLFGTTLPGGRLPAVAVRAGGHQPPAGPVHDLVLDATSRRRRTTTRARTGSGSTYRGRRAAAETVDTNIDDAARQAAGKQADQILAEEQVSLPLDPLPNIAAVEQADRRATSRTTRSSGCSATSTSGV